MTTIAFDGKTLVGDTRRTWSGDLIDNASKLVRVKDTLYKGENVLALAGAGKSSLIGKLQQLFVDDPSRFESHFRMARKAGIMSKEASCQLLIVTDKDVHTFDTADPKCKITPYSEKHTFYELIQRDKKPLVVLGTGQRETGILMSVLNLPITLAVACASLADMTFTSSTLSCLTFDGGEVVQETLITYQSMEELYKELREHVHSDDFHYRYRTRSLHVRTLSPTPKPPRPETKPHDPVS